MAVQVKDIAINGKTYRLNTLPGTQCLSAFFKFMSIIGTPLKTILEDNDATPQAKMAEMVGVLCSRLGDDGTVPLVLQLVDGLTKDHKKVDFDQEFSANLGVLTQIIVWAVDINFRSFLAENPLLSGLLSARTQVLPIAEG